MVPVGVPKVYLQSGAPPEKKKKKKSKKQNGRTKHLFVKKKKKKQTAIHRQINMPAALAWELFEEGLQRAERTAEARGDSWVGRRFGVDSGRGFEGTWLGVSFFSSFLFLGWHGGCGFCAVIFSVGFSLEPALRGGGSTIWVCVKWGLGPTNGFQHFSFLASHETNLKRVPSTTHTHTHTHSYDSPVSQNSESRILEEEAIILRHTHMSSFGGL